MTAIEGLPYTAEMLERREQRLSAEPSFACIDCGDVADMLTPYGMVCAACMDLALEMVAWRIRCQGHLEMCCEHEMTWLFDDQAEPGAALLLCLEIAWKSRQFEQSVTVWKSSPGLFVAHLINHALDDRFYLVYVEQGATPAFALARLACAALREASAPEHD